MGWFVTRSRHESTTKQAGRAEYVEEYVPAFSKAFRV